MSIGRAIRQFADLQARIAVIEAFRKANAIAPGAACTLKSLGLTESSIVRKLLTDGTLHTHGPGNYWLDEERGARWQRAPKLFLVMVGGCLLAGAGIALAYWLNWV